jgi:hypothetical protein
VDVEKLGGEVWLKRAASSLLGMLDDPDSDDRLDGIKREAFKSLSLQLSDMIDVILDGEWPRIAADATEGDISTTAPKA